MVGSSVNFQTYHLLPVWISKPHFPHLKYGDNAYLRVLLCGVNEITDAGAQLGIWHEASNQRRPIAIFFPIILPFNFIFLHYAATSPHSTSCHTNGKKNLLFHIQDVTVWCTMNFIGWGWCHQASQTIFLGYANNINFYFMLVTHLVVGYSRFRITMNWEMKI